ncbi:MAG: archaetidylserine decarboxylase [Francisellaceae bacterium]
MLKDAVFIALQKLLPQAQLSRIVGRLANAQTPWFKNFLIKMAIKRFDIDLAQAERENIDAYSCFNDFFTRHLKAALRPVDTAVTTIVSPADGKLTQCGKITDEKLIQAKGKYFSLTTLLGEKTDGNYSDFATIYLSPSDYHRVHMPIDGKLKRMRYIPGKLYSVNALTAEHIDELFAKNERLICYFDTTIGEIAIIFVGAMLVAGIVTDWHGIITPNYLTKTQYWDYNKQNHHYQKGQEIGYFNFGSTVICLFPDHRVEITAKPGDVMMGTAIGTLATHS